MIPSATVPDPAADLFLAANPALLQPLIQLLIARLWHSLLGGPRYQMHFSRANGAQLEELMVLAGQGKLMATVRKLSCRHKGQGRGLLKEGPPKP